MATYSLQAVSQGYSTAPPIGGGAFTLGFPISTDQNLPQPYQPVVGDVILLGNIPVGFLVLTAWLEAGMSGTGTSTWFFGTTQAGGNDSRLSDPIDVVVSGMASKYFFVKGTPAAYIGSQVVPVMSLANAVVMTMTCSAVTGTGNFTGTMSVRGTLDFQNAVLSPAGGGQPNYIDHVYQGL